MMKKTVILGALAASLIVTGGTRLYFASETETANQSAEFMKERGVGIKNMSAIMDDGNFENMHHFIGEQEMNLNEMNQMMESRDFEDMQRFMDEQNINFGQMKPHMQEMHPDLSTQELEEMYKEMHGTGGASNSQNFKGMVNMGL